MKKTTVSGSFRGRFGVGQWYCHIAHFWRLPVPRMAALTRFNTDMPIPLTDPEMWQPAECLAMSVEQKNQLENWVRAPSTPQKIVLRARICLMAHEGLPNRRIAQDLKTSRPTVILWRNHFVKAGVAGLEHEPPGRSVPNAPKRIKLKPS